MTCTFTLRDPTATAIIELVTEPPEELDPDIFIETWEARFDIDDDGAEDVSFVAADSYELPDVLSGTRTVRLTELSTTTVPWELASIACDDADSTTDPATDSATFELALGETVTCTFTLRDPTATAIIADPIEISPDQTRVVPRPGEWSVKNVGSQMRCGGRDIDIDKARPDRITIVVQRGGDRLVGRGSLEGTNTRLTLKASGADRYEGRIKARIRGARTTIRYSWRVVSPERIVGKATANVKSQGVNCTITRQQEATFLGPS